MFKIINIYNNECIKAMLKKCNKDTMRYSKMYHIDSLIHLEFKTEKGYIVDVIPYGNNIKKIYDESALCAYLKIKIKDGEYYVKNYNTNGDEIYKYKVDLCIIIL